MAMLRGLAISPKIIRVLLGDLGGLSVAGERNKIGEGVRLAGEPVHPRDKPAGVSASSGKVQ